ncbi:MAG: enoyl-CoA hydratase-related protein [Actinomycetes bacterium]|jgi:enoyl-CoA hydratase/carnithine racemase
MEFVTVEIHDAVALVRLDRPPVNALNAQLATELLEAFTACQDPAIRAVVVTGKPHFAAGADIKEFKELMDSGEGRVPSANKLTEAVAALENLDKPTIAAVHGFALGGGCELSMGADFRYVSEDARIGQPEILLGIIPGAGGTQRLQRLVGYQKAKELVLTGRHIDAREALAIGYADKVAPVDELLDLALADAAEWAQKATYAIGAAKRALNAGRLPFDQGMAVEAEEFQKSFASEDAREGVDAFVGKREANFRGV